ncbi:MAG: hypothetical protein ACOC6G_00860 [Thermoproteota archaeon]
MKRTLSEYLKPLKLRDAAVAVMMGALLLGFLTLALTPEVTASGDTATYSGTWSGTYLADSVDGTFQFTVDFGEGTVTGWFTGNATGDINGTVSEGKFSATGTALGGTVNWTGTVSPGRGSISGDWAFVTPGIGSGTWSGTREDGAPVEIPGLPPEAEVSHHSDQVPVDFQLKATPNITAFKFQNFTLLTNSTQEVDVSLTVDSQVKMRYLLLSLQPSDTLALEVNVTLVPLSGVPEHNHSIGLYLDIEPDTTQVEVSSTLGLYINETQLETELGREIDASQLSWAYWNQTEWVEMESYINQDGYLIVDTDHLSQWTVIPEIPTAGILLTLLILTTTTTALIKKKNQNTDRN